MNNETLYDIARRYCVDDVPGASNPCSRIQEILKSLQCNEQPGQNALDFLQQQGLHALYRFAIDDLSYEDFYELALAEQNIRIHATMVAEQKRQAERKAAKQKRQAELQAVRERQKPAFERAKAERLAREKDPVYQARVRNQNLRAKYGIVFFVEREDFPRLMSILKRVDVGKRLGEDDLLWLLQKDTEGQHYYTDDLRKKYHRLEADFLVSEFHKTGNPWAAVNASSHYRKCDCAREADELICTINVEQKSPKLQAALFTTHGGALRDLERWDEALRLGEQAHKLQSRDYRPCTLLGAIYMDTHQYELGKAWYDKAYERGAKTAVVHRDILAIAHRFTKHQREKLRAVLAHDQRYQSVVERLSSIPPVL